MQCATAKGGFDGRSCPPHPSYAAVARIYYCCLERDCGWGCLGFVMGVVWYLCMCGVVGSYYTLLEGPSLSMANPLAKPVAMGSDNVTPQG